MLNKNFKPVQSLQRGLHLLEVIAQHREGAYLKDLAKAIDCSAPAAYHLVCTLADSGFVRRLEDPVRYVLGDKFQQLSQNQTHDRFYKQAHLCLQQLRRDHPGIGLYFSEYLGNNVVVRAYMEPGTTGQVIVESNYILPPYSSAGSLAHLAFWEQEIREDYQTRYAFEVYGLPYWKTRAAFDAALSQMREKKAFAMPSPNGDCVKIGAPLFRPDVSLAAALTLQWNLKPKENPNPRKKQLLAAANQAQALFAQSLSDL